MRTVSPNNIPKNAKVYIYATDTCYGFAARWNDPEGISMIQDLKGRENTKALSLLFSDTIMMKEFTEMNEDQEYFFTHQTDPISGILYKKPILKNFFPSFETVSCRVETKAFPVHLSTILGMPVTSTSVNLSGKPELYDAKSISIVFEEALDNVVLIDSGAIPKVAPSSIWDLTQTPFEQIR